MTIFVDTSVWSLAFRRDSADGSPQVEFLPSALAGNQLVVSTGLVLQELLQGFNGANAELQLLERFADLAFVIPSRETHVEAARLRNHCRGNGVQASTVDCVIAQLCIENDCDLLTVDQDFEHIARFSKLKVLAFKN